MKMFYVLLVFILFLVILSLFSIMYSQLGKMNTILIQLVNGIKSKTKSLLELLVLFILILSLLKLIGETGYSLLSILKENNPLDYINYMNGSNNNEQGIGQDPVRWWPSGTPQVWTIVASVVATFRYLPASLPVRVRAAAPLGVAGLTGPATMYFHAVENPVGFNSLMYTLGRGLSTGQWPHSNSIPAGIADNDME